MNFILRSKIYLLISIVASVLMISCDKVEAPYYYNSKVKTCNPPNIDFSTVPTSSVEQIVLMEEFTGFRCNNCPEGHEEIEKLLKSYPNKFIVISYHVLDQFAAPKYDTDNNDNIVKYDKYDFRTPEGKYLETKMNINSLPTAIFNRQKTGETYSLKNLTEWNTNLSAALGKKSKFWIELQTDYNTSTKEVCAHINVQPTIDMTADEYNQNDYYVQVAVVENNIISQQKMKDYSFNENYTQKHVFRTNFYPENGLKLTKNIGKLYKPINNALKLEPNWNENNIELVCYVTDAANNVLQAAKINIF